MNADAEKRFPHMAYLDPTALRDWPPLTALRQWLHDELELSRKTLYPGSGTAAKRRAKAR